MHFLRRASLRCVVDMTNFSRGQELTTRLADFYSTLVKNSASVHECIEQLLGQSMETKTAIYLETRICCL